MASWRTGGGSGGSSCAGVSRRASPLSGACRGCLGIVLDHTGRQSPLIRMSPLTRATPDTKRWTRTGTHPAQSCPAPCTNVPCRDLNRVRSRSTIPCVPTWMLVPTTFVPGAPARRFLHLTPVVLVSTFRGFFSCLVVARGSRPDHRAWRLVHDHRLWMLRPANAKV